MISNCKLRRSHCNSWPSSIKRSCQLMSFALIVISLLGFVSSKSVGQQHQQQQSHHQNNHQHQHLHHNQQQQHHQQVQKSFTSGAQRLPAVQHFVAVPRQPTVIANQKQPTFATNYLSNINGPRFAGNMARPAQLSASVRPLHTGDEQASARDYQQALAGGGGPSICQPPGAHSLPLGNDEWRTGKVSNKCHSLKDSALESSAIGEFKMKLDESSADLRQLLTNYLGEFRTLSLGLVLVARNETLNRLRANLIGLATSAQTPSSPIELSEASAQYEFTRRLFDSMFAHLLTYNLPEAHSSTPNLNNNHHQPHLNSNINSQHYKTPIASSDLNQEIGLYFKRLHVVQLKRLLEVHLLERRQWQGDTRDAKPLELDLDCLDNNLANQQRVELILEQLTNAANGSQHDDSPPSSAANSIMNPTQLEQTKLGLSIRQSFEFARTLLNSLSLSSEMFSNLTRFTEDWMPSRSCHVALARMTVCQECSAAQSSYAAALAPCENYCLNVARGCMNDLYELNRFWSEHLSALRRFKTNMIQVNNIENVMSNLESKLSNFMEKLQQQYSTSTTTTTTRREAASQMENYQLPQSARELIKWCPKNAAPASSANQAQPQPQDGFSGAFRSVAAVASEWLHASGSRLVPASHHSHLAPPANGLPRPASKMMPATQQRPVHSEMIEAALRARSSPAMSLFNRLDGFVLQLDSWRDFFAEWPQRVCTRLRASRGATSAGAQADGHAHERARTHANGSIGLAAGGGGECWNGRDFSGYNKPLAIFGSPISSGHPELSQAQAQPINPMVLNLVARLKEVGAQLTRKSIRSASQLSLFAELSPLASSWSSIETKVSESLVSSLSGGAKSRSLISKPSELLSQLGGGSDDLVGGAADSVTTSGALSKQRPDEHVEPDGEAAESEGDEQDLADQSEAERADLEETDEQAAASDEDNTHESQPDQGEQVPDCALPDCRDLLMQSAATGAPIVSTSGDLQQTDGATALRQPLDEQLAGRFEQDNLEAHGHNQVETIVAPKYQVPSVNVGQQQHQQQQHDFMATNEISSYEQQSNQLIQVPDSLVEQPQQANSSAVSSAMLTVTNVCLVLTLAIAILVLYKYWAKNLRK